MRTIRTAFTLIELIFVVLLIGILGGVGTMLYRPDKLHSDARFVAMRLLQTRYEAIGFDHRNFDGSFEDGPGCLTLTRAGMEENLSRAGSYRMQSETVLEVTGMSGERLCFDSQGRPHDGDFTLSTLLQDTVDIRVGNGRKSYTIKLFPISGYATME